MYCSLVCRDHPCSCWLASRWPAFKHDGSDSTLVFVPQEDVPWDICTRLRRPKVIAQASFSPSTFWPLCRSHQAHEQGGMLPDRSYLHRHYMGILCWYVVEDVVPPLPDKGGRETSLLYPRHFLARSLCLRSHHHPHCFSPVTHPLQCSRDQQQGAHLLSNKKEELLSYHNITPSLLLFI